MARAKKEIEQDTAERPEVGVQSVDQTIYAATVTDISRPMSYVPAHDANARFVIISYPKDFSGRRFFEDGKRYEMSKESADDVVKKGIGKIVS